ncbi:asparagine synthase (glutamine-hydrolyzing) [Halalkalibacterium halodurans]|uniref:asparagine synthase (glutamine-hydrolyzing) n=1 Tax=Halalkalibacterium halodurans TaxID=86665 RepID=UPI002AA99F7B|nr:asparagine synthase (glutamine-hydrolyzing) [Halalkalibacterium halodurans]MDY7222029.1 asparagine synthase (glutamine-hydrolyzing) [Halalkalibacterium halodurans]MDY7241305.1 asparagine synthase (glutamine-hydrolyzing) [Halalkalibacterium halodurans]MED4082917.1 asparagine synthase (glutamine-hydrolyzing) [Halalkalibacterium halodurans]MED4084803.1 asparagine synthase (glutamine-hydrolyzing) [Halalkalibacterium halodurans]MED4106089.1 asparagine synthase (glutamine-hydrolyzing) [Halalkalib
MCGITGWVDWRRNLQNETETIKQMAETQTHRGPDDLNVWTEKHAALGHSRLIVVDPEGGCQPMMRERNGKRYTIVYNGELYNTEDLRKELIVKGYQFQGHSDTEVLLVSYIEWGYQCVEKFNGIFAFAIWNDKDQSLFMARDRLGVKPLFYTVRHGFLLFATEIKALLAHPEIEPVLTEEGLSEVLGLGPSRSPGNGVFDDIQELRPAHLLTYDRNGAKVSRYWRLKSMAHSEDAMETAAHLRDLLEDTVERQLFADVPVGMFLSGGVDSSALTAIAALIYEREGKGPIRTYSIDYDENDKYFKANDFQPNADGPWVEKVSTTFRTNHHNAVISIEELANQLKRAVELRDLPGMADVDSSLYWFCKQIKKDVTVGLSGECADEIFGGYPWFHKPEVMNFNGFPWMRSADERQELLHERWRQKLNLPKYVHDRYKETIAETPRFEEDTPEEARRREISYLNMVWFMTTLLDRKDRMSMGASLEVRVPFSDHRIVEYAWNIPWEIKQFGGREKGILRKALEGILPDEVLYRKKSPYPKTHHPKYTKMVQQEMERILGQSDSPLFDVVNRKKLKELTETGGKALTTPYFGQLMTGPQLLAHFIQMEHWLKHYNIKLIG